MDDKEKQFETEIEKQQYEEIKRLNKVIDKLEIENNLMKQLLTTPPTYTYGIR